MDLGPYLAYNGVDYECTICERFFGSENALYAHCRGTSRHVWCERCCRVFISTPAKDIHLRESSRHNICSTCPQLQDFMTRKDLEDHLVESHYFCPDCDIYYDTIGQLREHDIIQHHLCVKCNDYFANENNLQMHQQKHQPRNIECYGCYQTFKSFSGMLIHLESGNCGSGVTEEEIDNIARKCYQSRKYVIEGLEDGGWLYNCPSCDREFMKLSALYQHCESVPLCSSPLNGHGCLAKLERFIAQSL